MAITSMLHFAPTHKNRARGAFLDTGTVKKSVVSLGFVPAYVKLVNATDRTIYEWFQGMAAGTTLKTVAAGTVTLDTGDAAITVSALDTGAVNTWTVYEMTEASKADTSRLNTTNEVIKGFSIPVAVVITNKQFYFEAHE